MSHDLSISPRVRRPGRCVSALLALVLALALTGCGGDESDPASTDTAATTATGDASTSLTDTGQTDVSQTAADTATTTAPPDIGADVPLPVPGFTLGTNIVYEARPAAFTPLDDGDEVPITFGAQGAWMIVLAFKEFETVANPFTIEAEVSIDGGAPDSLVYVDQETFPGGDGYTYYYNFFLALSRVDPPAKGTPATVTCTITDADGNVTEVTRTVISGDAT